MEITMRFEVLTAATVVWDMMPCSQDDVYRHAEWTSCLHHHL